MYPTRSARVPVKGAAARCCCRVQLLEWRVRSGRWCRCRVCYKVLQLKWCALWSWHVGAIAGCCCRAHKTQVLILQMYQGSELGSLRHDSGMIRGMIRKPILFGFRKLCCLSLFFSASTYHNCYAAMARPARRPWAGPEYIEYEEYEDLNTHL